MLCSPKRCSLPSRLAGRQASLHASRGQGYRRWQRRRELTKLGKRTRDHAPRLSARLSRRISPPEKAQRRDRCVRPVGDRKAPRGSPCSARFVPNGEGAVRYQCPDRLPARHPGDPRRARPLSAKAISLVTWMEVLVGTSSGDRARHAGLPERIRVGSHRPVAERGCHRSQAARRDRMGIRAGARDVVCDPRCQGISRRRTRRAMSRTRSETRFSRPSRSYAAPRPAGRGGGR